MIQQIVVAGAGTMGSGIAMVFALKGYRTMLFDVNSNALKTGRKNIEDNINQLITKEKITTTQGEIFLSNLSFTSSLSDCTADLFIEAIIEKTTAKIDLFTAISKNNSPQTILATNTSSLSVSAIQATIPNPERVLGLHFFNPAPQMKLVEIVRGKLTADSIVANMYELCKQLGKVPVICKDAPGFIVNRVARHYYLEAMKLVEAGTVSIADADALMEASGFKMGPFKLMDLIGMDINLSVSQSLYEAFGQLERFKPSALQVDMFVKGKLGRKTGQGFYQY